MIIERIHNVFTGASHYRATCRLNNGAATVSHCGDTRIEAIRQALRHRV